MLNRDLTFAEIQEARRLIAQGNWDSELDLLERANPDRDPERVPALLEAWRKRELVLTLLGRTDRGKA